MDGGSGRMRCLLIWAASEKAGGKLPLLGREGCLVRRQERWPLCQGWGIHNRGGNPETSEALVKPNP
jgi:hypothetical protein